MNVEMSRRGFIFGVAAGAAVAGYGESAPTESVDPNLTVFVSDLHVPSQDIPLDDKRDEAAPNAMVTHLAATVDRILAMRPRPARVVALGDIGYVVCRASRDWVELSLVQTDFYFRTYRPEGESRPPEWAQMVRENEGESCRLRIR